MLTTIWSISHIAHISRTQVHQKGKYLWPVYTSKESRNQLECSLPSKKNLNVKSTFKAYAYFRLLPFLYISQISLNLSQYSLHDLSLSNVYRSTWSKQKEDWICPYTATPSFNKYHLTVLQDPPDPTLTHTNIYLGWTINTQHRLNLLDNVEIFAYLGKQWHTKSWDSVNTIQIWMHYQQ